MRYANKKHRLASLSSDMVAGHVYRAGEIEGLGKDSSRDLNDLLKAELICRAGPGLYYKPRRLAGRAIPANTERVLQKFLRSDQFLVRHISDFNKLGLGTTQHAAVTYVYNRKRSGAIELDGRKYMFVVRKLPQAQTNEYLLVDMLNNLKSLGEDSHYFLQKLAATLPKMDLKMDKFLATAEEYGKRWVKRYLKKQDKIHGLSA